MTQEINRERQRRRQRQAKAVMPMIGPLLDAWDDLPNDVKDDPDQPYKRCDGGHMTQEINKAFHEAAGKCAHKWEVDKYWKSRGATVFYCKCGASYEQGVPKPTVPDYADDPRLVIEVMREIGLYEKFASTICFSTSASVTPGEIYWINIDLIMDRTGKLAVSATEWLNQQKGKSA